MIEVDLITKTLDDILGQYKVAFTDKVYREENDDTDLLMAVFGITPNLKRENRQYWGRELGMCWQRLIVEIFRYTREDYGSALRFGSDEPCDLTIGNYAMDTK